MKKLILVAAISAVLVSCASVPTVSNSVASLKEKVGVGTTTDQSASQKSLVDNKTQKQASSSVNQVPTSFDPVVIPEKNMKGRIAKKPYPDITGDTRKWTGVTKVSIPRYIISFDKKAGESSSASTGWTGPSANTHVHAKLTGVDEATFQRITNKAYRDFEQKLAAAGYEVIGIDQLKNTAEYQTWKADAYPKVGKGASKYMADNMRSFSQFKQYFRHGNLMNETRAAIVEPNLMINFASFGKQSSRQSGFQSSSATASVSLGPSVNVNGTMTGITLKKCDKRGQCFGDAIRIQTGQVVYSETPFASIEDTTSGAVKTVQAVTNALSMLSGTSTRKDSEKTVTADASAYEKAALEAIYETHTRFINKLKAADKTN